MTPLEISEYKQRWMSKEETYAVRLHSDLDWKGKDWCRKRIPRESWSMSTWTNVYEHTFYFESEIHANEFAKQWPEYTNQ